MKLYSLLAFTLIGFGYNTQAQTDTTKPPKYNLNENGIIDFWKRNAINRDTIIVGEEGLLKKDESTFQSLLSGRVAGVTVVPGQAGIGSSTEIYIRGLHSITGNQQPLYIVDGIPYHNQTINWNPYKDPTVSWSPYIDSKIDIGSRIADISIFDIESIEVVQNSSALAIYGAQAANGAILITTKRGNSGTKFNVSFSTGLTVETPLVLPKFQNSYGQGDYGVFDATSVYSWGPKFNGQQFKQFDTPAYGWVNGQLTIVRLGDIEAVQKAKDLGYQTDVFTSEYKAYPNNVRDFFETAISNANNVAISGSAEKWNYRLSVSNHNLNGIVPNSGIAKNNVTLNFAVAPLKFLTISSSLGYNTNSGKIANANIMQSLTLMSRSVNIASLKEYLQRGAIESEFQVNDFIENDNPYKQANYSYNRLTNDAYNGNMRFNVRLLKNWHLNYLLAIDHSKNRISNNDIISSTYHPTFFESAETKYKFGNTNHTIYTTATITPIDALEINSMAGFISSKQKVDFSRSANTPSFSTKYTEDYSTKNSAIFAQLNLRLLDLYFIEIQGRDEKEKSTDDRSAFSYSASAGMSFKKFLKPTGIVSNATIRASYGQIERLNSIKYAFTPSGNTKDKTVELGFNLELMSRHLLSATLFRTKTENTMISIPLPNGTSTLNNIGEITYQGINLSATGSLLSTPNSSAFLNITFSKSISRLTKLVDGMEYFTIGKNIYKEGEELSLLKYNVPMQHNGKIVYSSTGFPKEAAFSTDPSLMNQSPDFTMNFAPTYRYKKLSVSILCSWQKGGKIFSNMIYLGTLYGTLKETDNREKLVTIDGYTYNSQTDTYTPYTANISKEIYLLGHILRDHRKSIIDASFFKIRELSVSYTFDSPNKRYFQNVSVSLIGRNLLLLTKQDHFDPETSFLGTENFAIPTTRSFSLQLTATF
jgi:TonB-dependent SusC/RagA subfamily outer membrane receptor